MSQTPLTQEQVLLIKAAEDEQALSVKGLPNSIRGFHAQQAVEKLYKALLSAHNIRYERTHVLTRLRQSLLATGEHLPDTPINLEELEEFAVVYRYDMLVDTEYPDSEQLRDAVSTLRAYVTTRIATLSGSGELPPVQ